ncbi:unnamed protein product [Victoria cruziana]
MERVNEAMSRVKTLMGMEVEEPEAQEDNVSLIDDFNRNCTLSTKQVLLAFLMGPKRQMRMMIDPVRVYATAVYIASIIIALLCALYVRSKLLTLLAIILEFGSLVWYSLSYVPFARSMVSKVLMACFDTEF